MISPLVCVSFLKPLLHLKSFILIDSLAESQSDIYFWICLWDTQCEPHVSFQCVRWREIKHLNTKRKYLIKNVNNHLYRDATDCCINSFKFTWSCDLMAYKLCVYIHICICLYIHRLTCTYSYRLYAALHGKKTFLSWQTWRKSYLKELENLAFLRHTKKLTLFSSQRERVISCSAKHICKYIWLAF